MVAMKFLILAACVGIAVAYSTGAPKDACADLTPQHGPVKSQTSAAPYSLSPSTDKVRRGDTIKLTLRGNNASDKIKGFLIQARDGALPIGQFKVVDQLNSQLLDCDSKGNSITHKKINDNGISEVTFQWIAPRDFQGQVQFVGTVALNGGVFWNTLRSQTVGIN